jgi:glycosyltransferase involved in cell wall biosynthesis
MSQLATPLHVLFIAIGEQHRASSRFRVWQWLPHLGKAGIECRALPYIRTSGNASANKLIGSLKRKINTTLVVHKEILAALKWADVVVIQEALLPSRLLNAIKRTGVRIIFDFSDPVHLLHRNPTTPFHKRLFYAMSELSKFNLTLRLADYVVVENDALLPVAESYGAKGVVMRGPIDIDWFKPLSSSNTGIINIGWTGSPATFCYLKPLLPVIDEIGSKHKIKLTLIGAGYQPLNLKHVNVEFKNWSLETEPELVASFDIGLFYLGNSPIEQVRGGGKLYVYMACGVPVIASDVGIGRQSINEAKCGLLAASMNDWKSALTELVSNYQLRNSLREQSRAAAVAKYSHYAYTELMLSILHGKLSDKLIDS